LFLAVVIDLFSRRVVGWSMQPDMRRNLVIDALEMAWLPLKWCPHSGHTQLGLGARLLEFWSICGHFYSGAHGRLP
jgi:transposase InsO family protein